jgi:hypothetical protein
MNNWSSGGDGRSGKPSKISLTMVLCFQVMVPQALVFSIATSSRNVQGWVGPALAKMMVVGPTISIITRCLHFFQLIVRHEVHAIHRTGLACADGQGYYNGEGKGINVFMPNRRQIINFGDERANPYHHSVFDIEHQALLIGPGPATIVVHLE